MKRSGLIFILIALVGALLITRGLVAQPGYTDAFYHFNAAERLASGQGLTEDYLWMYIGAPDSLPAPSHLYWMPMTSLMTALGMWIFNAPGDYAAAQTPLALMLAGTACVGYWLGLELGGKRRHAWVAGLITLFSGFFMRFWGATDTFAPYALFGSLSLVFMGLGVKSGESQKMVKNPTLTLSLRDFLRSPEFREGTKYEANLSPSLLNSEERGWGKGVGRKIVVSFSISSQTHPYIWFALCGAMAALGHLTRADGVLLLIVGWAVVGWAWRTISLQKLVLSIFIMTAVYLIVMSPWIVRSLNTIGSPLPVGGTQGIWYTAYDDIFNYPPDSSPQTFFADGIGLLLSSRWDALRENLGTFVAIEGMIVLTPLMLIGLWMRRRDAFLRGFWLYALGVHLAMTFVFTFPGVRGGLFHSVAALLPWWAALGAVGLDDVVDWVAKRRRKWNATTAKWIFSSALVIFVVFLSLLISLPRRVNVGTPTLYSQLSEVIPVGSRVMINDPAQLYYFTGLGGVVLPNEPPDVIPEIAQKYGVGYLLLEGVTDNGQAAASAKLWSILAQNPDFLIPVPLDYPGVKLYEIRDDAL